ncbi:hypothetical protein RB195_015590 [Necator americanus]|uniref:Uncharacterized protein n=1 Tax=Necator americanus TaxID=51031 RepID=A0ABR1E6H2_NECAM
MVLSSKPSRSSNSDSTQIKFKHIAILCHKILTEEALKCESSPDDHVCALRQTHSQTVNIEKVFPVQQLDHHASTFARLCQFNQLLRGMPIYRYGTNATCTIKHDGSRTRCTRSNVCA